MNLKVLRVIFEVTLTCIVLQIHRSSSCNMFGSVLLCAFQNLSTIPAVPPHVTHLFLEMNEIREITATSLSQLPTLQHLDLGHQRVPLLIRNNAFSKQRNLKKLALGSNRNLHLEPLAFAGLSNLKILHLYHCDLNETILSSSVLEPLTSLETLDLFGNGIRRLRPAAHFANMINLKDLSLKLNPLDQICEGDIAAFQGADFRLVNLNGVQLGAMSSPDFDWEKCGNPFKNMTIEMLDFSNNHLSLQGLTRFFTAIQGTKIDKLKLSGHYGSGFSFHNLPDPDNSTFEGLKDSNLQHLDLSKNRIFALQGGVFIPFKNAQIIDISQNNVNQIHKNAFDGLQDHLLSLNLSHNLLGEIYSYAFASLTSLRVLDLSNNHIGALGHHSFSGLINLQGLFLTGNAIRTLGFPVSLSRLQILKLDDNKLKSVHGIENFAKSMLYLDVSSNRLRNLGDVHMILSMLKNLQYLLYANNPVDSCVVDSDIEPHQLQSLHLDHISLQSIWSQGKCLDLFHKLGHLQFLSLTSNNIRTLPLGIFKGLKAIQKIDLSSNSLTSIQTSVIPPNLQMLLLADNFIAEPGPEVFQSLQFLDLRMNRFHCGPGLKKFVTWIKETNVTLMGSTEELTCEFPSGFHGVPLLNVYGVDEKQ